MPEWFIEFKEFEIPGFESLITIRKGKTNELCEPIFDRKTTSKPGE